MPDRHNHTVLNTRAPLAARRISLIIVMSILNNGYVLAALGPLAALVKKAPKIVVEEAAALHPLTYLPFHLIGAHLTARLMPKRHISYPAQFAFGIGQYAVEHYSAEFPSVAAMGPLLVLVALSQAPYVYYRAFKLTEGTTSLAGTRISPWLTPQLRERLKARCPGKVHLVVCMGSS